MKLTTIWTLKGLPISGRMDRTRDYLALAIAHRMPRRVAYWTYIDMGVRHMTDEEVVPGVRYMDLLGRMERQS